MARQPIFPSAAAVEEAFYSALAHADLASVMSLWADDEEVICIHPGGQRLLGLHAVRQSFERILAGGPINIQIRDVQMFESATLAVHNLIEQITVTSSGGTERVIVLATNIYTKTSVGWQILVHHAAPGHAMKGPAHEASPGRLH